MFYGNGRSRTAWSGSCKTSRRCEVSTGANVFFAWSKSREVCAFHKVAPNRDCRFIEFTEVPPNPSRLSRIYSFEKIDLAGANTHTYLRTLMGKLCARFATYTVISRACIERLERVFEARLILANKSKSRIESPRCALKSYVSSRPSVNFASYRIILRWGVLDLNPVTLCNVPSDSPPTRRLLV